VDDQSSNELRFSVSLLGVGANNDAVLVIWRSVGKAANFSMVSGKVIFP